MQFGFPWVQFGSMVRIGSTLDLTWNHQGSVLDTYWFNLGSVLDPSKIHLGSSLSPSIVQPSHLVELIWFHPKSGHDPNWIHLGSISERPGSNGSNLYPSMNHLGSIMYPSSIHHGCLLDPYWINRRSIVARSLNQLGSINVPFVDPPWIF